MSRVLKLGFTQLDDLKTGKRVVAGHLQEEKMEENEKKSKNQYLPLEQGAKKT
jgi:hypothetical protein